MKNPLIETLSFTILKIFFSAYYSIAHLDDAIKETKMLNRLRSEISNSDTPMMLVREILRVNYTDRDKDSPKSAIFLVKIFFSIAHQKNSSI